jgi:hypothetical protein
MLRGVMSSRADSAGMSQSISHAWYKRVKVKAGSSYQLLSQQRKSKRISCATVPRHLAHGHLRPSMSDVTFKDHLNVNITVNST